jgi:hypothetical protein
MRITRSAAAAAVFAAVLLAGACSSNAKSAGAAGGPAAQTSTAVQSSTAAAAPSTVTSAPDSASSSASAGAPSTAVPSSSGPTGSTGSTGTSGSACQGSNLKVTIVHGTDADPDPTKPNASATVSITNTGTSTCTVQGHPKVDLISTSGDDWPLVNQSGATPKLTLQPGTAALAALYLLPHTPDAGTQAFQVKSAVITPPDTKTPTTVAWPWNWALERQDAATNPGTFIGAVNQTGTS